MLILIMRFLHSIHGRLHVKLPSIQTVEKDSISHTFDTSRWPVWKDLIKTELAHFDIENAWL